MAIHNTLSLLFISYVSISFHLATSQISPGISPSPGPASATSLGSASSPSTGIASTPSLSPAANAPVNHVSQPPSTSDPPSESISPKAEEPAASDDFVDFDISPTNSEDANPGLKNICDSTDYPTLCIATVKHHPLNGDPDIPSVLQLSMKTGIGFAKHAMTLAKQAAEKPENADLAPSIRDCMEFYNDAAENYEKALTAFPDNDIGTMRIMLSAALTDIGSCDDAIKGTAAESSLMGFGAKLTNITSNCLAIATLMH